MRRAHAIAGCLALATLGAAISIASGTDHVTASAVATSQVDAAVSYLRPQSILKAEPLTDEALDHVLMLREEYGLSIDATYVRGLYEDPLRTEAVRAGGQLLGDILLGPDELEHAFRRAAAEWVGSKVDLLAIDSLPGYAGTVIESDGSIALLCARCDTSQTLSEIEEQLIVDEPYELTVRQVAHSTEEILDEGERLSALLQSKGVEHGGLVDTAENQLRLIVPPDARSATLESSVALQVEYTYEEVEPDVNKNDYIIYALVEGGQQIVSPTGSLSTSSFTVNNGNVDLILLAGHMGFPNECTFQGQFPSQGGATLGRVTGACQYGGNLDNLLVRTTGWRANYGRVHYTSSLWREAVTFGVSNQNMVNHTVCQTGWATTGISGNANVSQRCGTVSSLQSMSPCGGNSPAWTLGLGNASYQRLGGDSGAAVIWPTIYGYGAAGSHSCQNFSGGNQGAVFSQFSVAAAQWNLTISPAL